MEDIYFRNNIKIFGEGEQTLVFGHGFGCSQTIWKYMVPFFSDDYRIVLFDYVGSGKSDCLSYDTNRYHNLHGYAEDLLEVLTALDSGPVIFIGHSVSGMIGLLAAVQKPELFKSLIMIGASARYLNELPDYYGGFDAHDIRELLQMMEKNFVGWASANAAELINAPEQPLLAKKLEETFHAEDSVIMRNFAEATFLSDHRADLQKVAIPTLLIQCAQDSIVPIAAADYLHAHIANSTLRVLEAKGHYPQLSLPQETSMVIRGYLADIT